MKSFDTFMCSALNIHLKKSLCFIVTQAKKYYCKLWYMLSIIIIMPREYCTLTDLLGL